MAILPDATGIDILRRVRQKPKVPVLFCTARDDQDDVVRALREGADDYLVKPLRRMELLARIESVARRARKMAAKDEVFEVDDLRVDCVARAISRDGAVFELTGKDFDLAVLFLRNVGRLLSRSHIHEAGVGDKWLCNFSHHRYPREPHPQQARVHPEERLATEKHLWPRLPAGAGAS